jgi:stage V sporulation protein SpoVS
VLSSATPTEWARQLVRGAYDLHVHVAPDVMRRRITDLQLARRCWDVGLAGFVLKSHYVSTAERAAVINEALGGEVRAIGALALNASVGGMNPIAVEIAAREGARILWMPTVDALNHRATSGDLPKGATPPMWLALQQELEDQGIAVDPVPVVDEMGRPLPATLEVLELAARHQLVVASGHLSVFETRAVADAAFEAGVHHVIATHPEFPQQDMGRDDQLALARQGAFLERCFTTPFTGKYDWARMVENIQATGPERTIVTTDLGQPHNPPVEDGLALMADALHGAGFSDQEITTMIVSNSQLLAGPVVPNAGSRPS